jgi:hypothetical protein
VGTGTKEGESSTGRVWATGHHHVTARSNLARVLKLLNGSFPMFFRAAVNRGYLKPWIIPNVIYNVMFV